MTPAPPPLVRRALFAAICGVLLIVGGFLLPAAHLTPLPGDQDRLVPTVPSTRVQGVSTFIPSGVPDGRARG